MMIGLLWFAQVVVFAAGLSGWWRDPPELHTNGRVARPLRIGISLSLVLAALLIWVDSNGIAAIYARWILLGMAASFVGDLVMARLIPVPSRLIGGMVAFAIGHACYIAGYRATLFAAGVATSGIGFLFVLAVYAAITALGWRSYVRNPQKPAALNAGALVYGLWISVMASSALLLALDLGGAWWWAALGGVVFMISDFLIGISEIGASRIRNVNDWVWLTYIAGQMGIIYAAWLAGGAT